MAYKLSRLKGGCKGRRRGIWLTSSHVLREEARVGDVVYGLQALTS